MVKPEAYVTEETPRIEPSARYNQEIEVPTRLVVVEEMGRILTDIKLYPTDMFIPAVMPFSQKLMAQKLVMEMNPDWKTEAFEIRPLRSLAQKFFADPDHLQPKKIHPEDKHNFTPADKPLLHSFEKCPLTKSLTTLSSRFTMEGSSSAEHLIATHNARPDFCVAYRIMMVERPTFMVVWTMNEFDLLGYPSLSKGQITPYVLSASPMLLKLVWQARCVNRGLETSQFPTWQEIFSQRVTLVEAWQLITRWPRCLQEMIVTKARRADFKALALYEMYQAVLEEIRINGHHYQSSLLEVTRSAFVRLFRIHLDPITFGPRPHSREANDIPIISTSECVAVRKHVYRYQIPRLIHHFHCVNRKRKPVISSCRYEARLKILDQRRRIEDAHNTRLRRFLNERRINSNTVPSELRSDFMARFELSSLAFQVRPLLRWTIINTEAEYSRPDE